MKIMDHEYFFFLTTCKGPLNLAMNIHIKHHESGESENIDLLSSSMANQKKKYQIAAQVVCFIVGTFGTIVWKLFTSLNALGIPEIIGSAPVAALF